MRAGFQAGHLAAVACQLARYVAGSTFIEEVPTDHRKHLAFENLNVRSGEPSAAAIMPGHFGEGHRALHDSLDQLDVGKGPRRPLREEQKRWCETVTACVARAPLAHSAQRGNWRQPEGQVGPADSAANLAAGTCPPLDGRFQLTPT